MLQLPLDQLVLVIAQAALLVILVARLWSAGLYRIYPFFFSYLLAELLRTVIMASIPFKGRSYPYFWMATELAVACFYALIVVELYRVVLRDLPGIATTSRRYITATVVVATLGSLLLLRLEETPKNLSSATFLIDSTIVYQFGELYPASSACVPGVLSSASQPQRSLLFHWLCNVYFLTKAAVLFVRTLGYYVASQVGTARLLVVSSACLLFWILTLNTAR